MDPQRCKWCGELPSSLYRDGCWNVYCYCLMAGASIEYYFEKHNNAVEWWNKTFGIDGLVSKELASIQPECSCESRDLMWYGCRCSYSAWKKSNSLK